MSKLQLIFDTGQVVRYHAHARMGQYRQTTAEHSWGCIALLLMLNPGASANLVKAVGVHDCGELGVGDLASGFKRAHPELAREHAELEHNWADAHGIPRFELDETETLWLKYVDQLEAFIYMRSRGIEWSHAHKQQLIDYAQQLDVLGDLEDLLNV